MHHDLKRRIPLVSTVNGGSQLERSMRRGTGAFAVPDWDAGRCGGARPLGRPQAPVSAFAATRSIPRVQGRVESPPPARGAVV